MTSSAAVRAFTVSSPIDGGQSSRMKSKSCLISSSALDSLASRAN